jgi:lipid A ethanolaminephosphotransferase
MRTTFLVKPAIAAFALAAYFVLFLNGAFWKRLFEAVAPAGNPTSTYDWLFLAAIGIGLFLLCAMFFGLFTLPYVFKPVVITLLFASAAAAYFMREYGIVIDSSMVTNTLQTDRAEAGDLLTFKFFAYVTAFGGLPAIVVALTRLDMASWPQEFRFRAISGGALTVLLLAILAPFAMNLTSVFREHMILKHELVPFNYLGALSKHASRLRESVKKVVIAPFGGDARKGASWPARTGKSITVLVVGETARAQNFSLNGYARPTNPKLATVPDLINFTDVASCGTATAASLPCMFSGLGRSGSNEQTAHKQEGLLDILKRVGLTVHWRDNQSGCKGICARVPTEIVATPEPKKFYELAVSFDDKLIDGLQEWIDKVPDHGVVVLHMMGSHGPAYFKRYPSTHEVFKPACKDTQFSRCSRDELVNAYDNTIVYTDHVLHRLIELLKANDARNVATSMVYVSDHGESLGERGLYLHGMPYALAPREQTWVPMMMWLSPRFQASYGVSASCVADKRKATLSHDNFFHSVMGMLDISSRVYDPALDLFAVCKSPEKHVEAVAPIR